MHTDELGHRVVAEAGNIDEGQRLAQTAHFALALLDVNLGGESVVPVAEIIEGRGLPFLFITGYAESGLPEPFDERPILRKPFAIATLGHAIEAVLAEPRDGI
jgi:DNA-binding response OmpR family regulator